jgi:hypothetical protein
MKLFFKVLLSLSFVFCAPLTQTFATSVEEEVLKEFSKEFMKSQAKKELAAFLNANHEILNSTNAQVGTTAVQYIGVMMAAYNLFTAETDKQRLFAAANIGVYFSPEPSTALILLAIQMADMIITLEHQKSLAKIYRKISEIEFRTAATLKQVFEQKYREQKRIIDKIRLTHKNILEAHESLRTDPVMIFLGDPSSNEMPETPKVQEAFKKVGDLYQLLLNYKVERIMFDGFVEVEKVDGFAKIAQSLKEFDELHQPMSIQVDAIMLIIRKFYSSLQASETLSELQKIRAEKQTAMEKYVFCSDAANRMLSAKLLDQDIYESDELFGYQKLLNKCIVHFNWSLAW